MTISGELVQDGLSMTMSVTGRYSTRVTGSLR